MIRSCPQCNLPDVQKWSENSERRSNKNKLRHVHREGGSKSVSICSCGNPSSLPARRYWNCTEDYSSMRGLLDSAFKGCKTIDQFFNQEASDAEQKVKELQVRIGDLMIIIVDHVTLKDEEGSKETVVKTEEGIEQDIKELLRWGLRIVSRVSYGF